MSDFSHSVKHSRALTREDAGSALGEARAGERGWASGSLRSPQRKPVPCLNENHSHLGGAGVECRRSRCGVGVGRGEPNGQAGLCTNNGESHERAS